MALRACAFLACISTASGVNNENTSFQAPGEAAAHNASLPVVRRLRSGVVCESEAGHKCGPHENSVCGAGRCCTTHNWCHSISAGHSCPNPEWNDNHGEVCHAEDACSVDDESCECFEHRDANFCKTCPECGKCQSYCGDPCSVDDESCECFVHRDANFCKTCPTCGKCQSYCGDAGDRKLVAGQKFELLGHELAMATFNSTFDQAMGDGPSQAVVGLACVSLLAVTVVATRKVRQRFSAEEAEELLVVE